MKPKILYIYEKSHCINLASVTWSMNAKGRDPRKGLVEVKSSKNRVGDAG